MGFGTTDVLLGMKWLKTLGDMKVNWKPLTMVFQYGGQMVTLRGDPSLCRTKVFVKSMVRDLQNHRGGFVVELRSLVKEPTISEHDEPKEMIKLLTRYADVFQMPSGLPPDALIEITSTQ